MKSLRGNHLINPILNRALAALILMALNLSATPLVNALNPTFQPPSSLSEAQETVTVALPPHATEVHHFERQPLHFERNEGQTDSEVKFLMRGGSYSLFLTGTETVMVLNPVQTSRIAEAVGEVPQSLKTWDEAEVPAAPDPPMHVIRMKLVGVNPLAVVEGQNQLRGRANYFTGNDPLLWVTNIPTFSKVLYHDAYPGIDLVYYGTEGQLEYDFVLAPGAELSRVAMEFEGVDEVEVNGQGDLSLRVAGREVRWLKPRAYQEIAGLRCEVEGKYVLIRDGAGSSSTQRVAFQVQHYDTSRALVIDPTLVYSTYLGGTGADAAGGIAVDAEGNAYVAATTMSVDFPTKAALYPSRIGGSDSVVAKFSPIGELIFSTYLGGTGDDAGGGNYPRICVDALGNPYIVGITTSTNFPVLNAIQASNRGGSDAFITALKPDGSAIRFSTYLGGSRFEIPYQIIASKLSGDIYIAGVTTSTNFPVQNAIQANKASSGGDWDGFITKLEAGGQRILYSTYFGGGLSPDAAPNDYITSLAEDEQGNLFFAGYTYSDDLPVTSAFQPFNAGTPDMFFGKLSPNGANLLYASYFGGSGPDNADAISVAKNGTFVLAGHTRSYGLSTSNAPHDFDNAEGSWTEGLVAVFNAADGTLVASAYFGGSHSDAPAAVVVDESGDILVGGDTSSVDFPTRDPLQPSMNGLADGFLTKFRSNDLTVMFSTFFGGMDIDSVRQIALDSGGNVVMVGTTSSTNGFPLMNPVQRVPSGNNETYITKISLSERLKIVRSSESVTLSWPAGATNFVLEATVLLPAASWETVTNAPSVTATELSVQLPLTGTAKFFRLRGL